MMIPLFRYRNRYRLKWLIDFYAYGFIMGKGVTSSYPLPYLLFLHETTHLFQVSTDAVWWETF